MKPKHLYLIALFVLLASYSLYQARFLVLGPRVWIENPKDGVVVESSVVTVSGRARNIAWISLNDRQIFTDKKGQWEETLIVSQGLSIMTVRVRDRFGRSKEDSVRLILN